MVVWGRLRGAEILLLQLVSDLLAVVTGLLLAYWIRLASGIFPIWGGWDSRYYLHTVLPTAIVAWMISLQLTHCYSDHPKVISFNRARRLLKASALAVALVVARNYFLNEPHIARLVFPIAFATTVSMLVLFRVLLQRFIVRLVLDRHVVRARTVIVGLGPAALRLAARMKMKPEYAYDLVGFIAGDESRVGQVIGSVPVLGAVDDLRRLVRERSINEVFVAQSEIPHEAFLRLFLETEKETARVSVIPNLVEMMRTPIFYDEVVGVPIYTIRETPLQGWAILYKRIVDIFVSLAGLVVLSPLLLVLAVLVRRSSPGPILYRQLRLGIDGRSFTILKFRTMPVDAEKAGPGWGNAADPRATSIGRFLREWNLDELPQLINVLRGDMSLVGPRPERPHFVEKFKEEFPRYMARHRVLAGMTGWAQVHGLRGDTSIRQRVRYDLYYIENWSPWLDIKILLMTFMNPRRWRSSRRSGSALATPLPDEPTGALHDTPEAPPAPTTPPEVMVPSK